MDPRVKTSAEDLRAQFDLLLKLRDREDEMNRALLGIRDLRNQLQALEKRLGAGEQTKTVVSSSADLRKKITTIEEELIQVNATAQEDEANYPTKLNSKLGYLTGVADSADTAPTESELAVFTELDKQLETQLASWRDVLSKDLITLNESMRKSNVPSVAPAAARTE
jgi:DNA repair exonuclease SbcCD ATPase subunit